MANVVKYKKVGDINLQGAIELDALTASDVPSATSGKKTLFLDVADTNLKTKDSSGTVAAIGGTYNLPTASDSVLGGIKIGTGLSIDVNGVVTASGGISDAPSDGKTYARKDAGWVEITSSDATSYGNPGGSGSRNSFVVATSNISWDGSYGDQTTLINGIIGNQAAWNNQATSGLYLRFYFETSVIINEMKFYTGRTETHGDWQIQGSNNGTDWTNVGSSFTLGGLVQTITSPSANTTRYSYYQLLGISGNVDYLGYQQEIEFKISR